MGCTLGLCPQVVPSGCTFVLCPGDARTRGTRDCMRGELRVHLGTSALRPMYCAPGPGVYLAGEDEWFDAEVLSFNEAKKVHLVRYVADQYESEEHLCGGPEACPWRLAKRVR